MNKTANEIYPKLLPWLARQNGVRLEQAQVMWISAMSDAKHQFPQLSDSAARHQFALASLQQRLQSHAQEQRAAAHRLYGTSMPPQTLTRMVDYQARMVVRALQAFAQAAQTTSAGWQKIAQEWKLAA